MSVAARKIACPRARWAFGLEQAPTMQREIDDVVPGLRPRRPD